jgi:hypothetical protein
VTRDDWQRVRPILTEALLLADPEARALLSTAALDDIVRGELLEALNTSLAMSSPSGLAHGSAGSTVSVGADLRLEKRSTLTSGDALADGRFLIIRQIGRGGMGVVYLAQDTSLGTLVALKIVPSGLMEEARRAAACSGHEHVVTVHNVLRIDHRGESLGVLVMEYIAGRPASRVLEDAPVAPDMALRWVRQAASAVGHAHDSGVLHCDLKPANLLITPDDRVKVVDFGIARATFDVQNRRAPTRGTLPYMAPEQLVVGEFSRAGDIYSLGVTLFELLTGRLPFDGDPTLMRMQILTVPAPRLADLASGLPDGLQAVVDRALAKNPGERFRSARAFARALEQLDASQTATIPVAVPRPPGPEPARFWTMLAASALAVVVLTAGMGFIASRAFEVVLHIETAFTATASDYLRVGREAILPFGVYWIPPAAVLGILAGARLLLRRWMKSRWAKWADRWNGIDPNFIAVSTLILGTAAWLTLTWMHAGVFVALFDLQQSPSSASVDAISYASRQAHLQYATNSAYLSFMMVLAGLRWLPQLQTRCRDGTTVRLMAWATLLVAVLTMAGPTLPRRFLFERFRVVRYDGRSLLVIGSAGEDRLLLYDPARRVGVPVAAPNATTTVLTSHIFEK